MPFIITYMSVFLFDPKNNRKVLSFTIFARKNDFYDLDNFGLPITSFYNKIKLEGLNWSISLFILN